MATVKAEFRVNGLAGPGLPSTVEELLSAVDSVEYVHVNLGAAKVAVTYGRFSNRQGSLDCGA